MTATGAQCPFCTLSSERIVEENAHGVLILDGFAVSLGHSLVISKRHVSSFFDLTESERIGLLSLLDRAKELVSNEHIPAGYNIGINDGAAAGQTVPHLHVHLIPRYDGDSPDPRGGVRWVLPEKAKYWP